jgi:hypothetical protein
VQSKKEKADQKSAFSFYPVVMRLGAWGPEILYHTSVSLSRGKLQKMQKKLHNPEMHNLCKITIDK